MKMTLEQIESLLEELKRELPPEIRNEKSLVQKARKTHYHNSAIDRAKQAFRAEFELSN